MKSLAVKASAGIIINLIIIGLVLFLLAGSFDFWQAWVFLGLLITSQIAISRYLLINDPELLKRRLRGGARAEKRISQKILISLMQMSFFATLTVSGLDHARGWSNLPVYLVVIGEIGVLVGQRMQFLAFKANTFASIVVEVLPAQRVMSSGVYTFVRHPMYSGLLVSNLFIPVALGSWYALPFFLSMLGVVILRLLDEEKMLRQNLPGYADYCQMVKYRLVPGIW